MPQLRGVSGFWLDIKALDSDRMHLVAEHGAKEGMLLFGVWVAIFTWQYRRAAPITGARHVANLTGLDIRTASKSLQKLAQTLPQTLVQKSGQYYCKRTLQVLEKIKPEQTDAGATVDHNIKGDRARPDPDPDLLPSLSPSQDLISGGVDIGRPRENAPPEKQPEKREPEKTLATRMWDVAEQVLGSRPLVGKLVAEHGEGRVMAHVGKVASMRSPPDDPKAYLTAMLQERKRNDKPRTKDDYDAKLAEWANSGDGGGRVDDGAPGRILEGDG